MSVESLFIFIVLMINFNTLQESSQKLLQEKFINAGNLFTKIIIAPVITYDLAALDDAIESFVNLEEVIAIKVLNNNDEMLASHFKEDRILKEHKDVFFKENKIENSSFDSSHIIKKVPIASGKDKLGYVYILFDKSNVLKIIQENKNRSYMVFIFALFIGFLIAYYLSHKLSISLKKASHIANSIASEEDVLIPHLKEKGDEIIQLFQAMYRMKIKIEDRTNSLNNSLRSLEQFMQALNYSAIVSKTDVTGNITYVNDKFVEISGYSTQELIGASHNIIRHEDMEKDFFENMWEILQSKKVFKGTIKNSTKSGKSYYVDSTIVPLLDENNNIIEFIGIRYDVTNLVHARNQAVNAEKSKDEFLSNMSHEIRTPLNAILGFVHILQSRLENSENISYLDIIEESSQTLLLVINDILDFSKINNGKLVIDAHEFYPHVSFKHTYQLFSLKAEEQKIQYQLELTDELPVALLGDVLRIQQIIYNFLSNAFKFTVEGGTVSLKVDYDTDKEVLSVAVEDEGVGMNRQTQERIFNAFEQADGSTTRKYGGTGLGLSISTRLAELMDGLIELESVEGEGSTFTLKVHARTIHDVKPQTEEVIKAIKKLQFKGNVLVAEDNLTNQTLMKIFLSDYGLDFTIVPNGLKAFEAFKEGSFDIILMDENMPVMNGIVAVEKIREYEKQEDLKGITIVAVTANVLKEDQERFKNAGMNDFIAKPINPVELERVFNHYL